MRAIEAGAIDRRSIMRTGGNQGRTVANRTNPAVWHQSCARQVHMETLVVYDKPSNGHHGHAEPDGGQRRWYSLADAGRHMEQGTFKINGKMAKRHNVAQRLNDATRSNVNCHRGCDAFPKCNACIARRRSKATTAYSKTMLGMARDVSAFCAEI